MNFQQEIVLTIRPSIVRRWIPYSTCVPIFKKRNWFARGFATSVTWLMDIGTGCPLRADVTSRAQMELKHVIEFAPILHLTMVDWTVWEQELRVRRALWIRVLWAPSGSCSVTCDIGMQRRVGSCDNPLPTKGGDNCLGDSREDRICLATGCTAAYYHSVVYEKVHIKTHTLRRLVDSMGLGSVLI
ncbi:hypothetical protein DPMN_183952 [Dreissena polymorpha]|uniref:Uncharacterized protein n=1 Tax=Dreissena polymorpha TaxID=45954 RepID=A0A9D4I5Z8_DREPO|nr:hypothetical protein DPMN_183952 [Dreissena polymorpha]